MRPISKHLILLLVVGLTLGAYRFIRESKAANLYHTHLDTGDTHLVRECAEKVELYMVASIDQKDWIESSVSRFNDENVGDVRVTIAYREARAEMQDILNRKDRPVLWATGSPVWASRLEAAWAERHGKGSLINLADPSSFRAYYKTPLVFLTTKPDAQRLAPALGGPDGWQNLQRLSSGGDPELTGGKKFRFAHVDPVSVGDGYLTMGLMLQAFHAKHGASGGPGETAVSPDFQKYLRDVERSLVFDDACVAGVASLTRSFAEKPTRYGTVLTSEAAALKAAEKNPELAVVYPNPTAVSEQVVARLNADYISKDQAEAATKFLDFLAKEDVMKAGIERARFRPMQEGGGLSFSPTISARRGQGFRDTYNAAELPPYEAVNGVVFAWRLLKIAPAPTL